MRIPHTRVRGPAVAPLALDIGMWLNMVNVKSPNIADLDFFHWKIFIHKHEEIRIGL